MFIIKVTTPVITSIFQTFQRLPNISIFLLFFISLFCRKVVYFSFFLKAKI